MRPAKSTERARDPAVSFRAQARRRFVRRRPHAAISCSRSRRGPDRRCSSAARLVEAAPHGAPGHARRALPPSACANAGRTRPGHAGTAAARRRQRAPGADAASSPFTRPLCRAQPGRDPPPEVPSCTAEPRLPSRERRNWPPGRPPRRARACSCQTGPTTVQREHVPFTTGDLAVHVGRAAPTASLTAWPRCLRLTATTDGSAQRDGRGARRRRHESSVLRRADCRTRVRPLC